MFVYLFSTIKPMLGSAQEDWREQIFNQQHKIVITPMSPNGHNL